MVTIRRAKLGEEVAVQKIANKIEGNYVGFVMLPMLTDSIKRNELLVAESEEKEIVGFMNFHKRKDGVTTLQEIAVKKEFRSMGIAYRLLHCLTPPIRLTCMAQNPACEWYKKNGFSIAKVRKGKKNILVEFIHP